MISARHALAPYQPQLVGGAWIIHVPLPPSRGNHWLNSNDRDHWSRRAKLTEYWRTTAYAAALSEALPQKQFHQVWVYAVLSFRTRLNTRRDACNFYPTVKACVDGITDTRAFWADDCDGIVTGPDMRRNDALAPGVTLVLCPVVVPDE